MQLTEPLRGQNLLHALNDSVANSATLIQLIPITADVFVFAYPVILVVRYILGVIKCNHDYKSDSIAVLLSAGYVTVINLIIQSIWFKDRPIFAGDSTIHLILDELPSASFPSDHAAVSMAIALMIYRVGRHRNHKLFKILGLVLIACSVLMSISRVAVGVHWPTDILAGWVVAIMVMIISTSPYISKLQTNYIIQPLIRMQERLFNIVGLPGK